MSENLSEEQVKEALESGYAQSEALLNDKDELDDFLYRLEQKINDMPFVGKKFSMIPVMISLVKNYVQGKYTTVPYGTILAVLSALIYFLAPIDIVPDFIPLAGYIDDMAVLGHCMNMVSIDIETYEKWRQAQGLN